jgi:hypothetical protein
MTYGCHGRALYGDEEVECFLQVIPRGLAMALAISRKFLRLRVMPPNLAGRDSSCHARLTDREQNQ